MKNESVRPDELNDPQNTNFRAVSRGWMLIGFIAIALEGDRAFRDKLHARMVRTFSNPTEYDPDLGLNVFFRGVQ